MFEVIARVSEYGRQEHVDIHVEARRSGHYPVNYRRVYPRDLFKSDFNYVMEEIANKIQEYIGNNPDEKV